MRWAQTEARHGYGSLSELLSNDLCNWKFIVEDVKWRNWVNSVFRA